MDPVYRVSFFKRLIDSSGHQADPCQGIVEVHASCADSAIETARPRFAELADVNGWWLRADYEKVELLPLRKRISNSAWFRNRGDVSHPARNKPR